MAPLVLEKLRAQNLEEKYQLEAVRKQEVLRFKRKTLTIRSLLRNGRPQQSNNNIRYLFE